MAGPDLTVLATATAVPDRCLAATDRWLFVCTDTAHESPLVQCLPYESLRHVTTKVMLDARCLSILTTRGMEITFRMPQTPEEEVVRFAALIKRKMDEYPAPPSGNEDLHKKSIAEERDEDNSSFVGSALVGAGDVVGEFNGLIGAGLILGGLLVDIASRSPSTEATSEPQPDQSPSSDVSPMRSNHLDIGDGIRNLATIVELRKVLAVDESVLATIQGQSGTSLVMTSQRILVADESEQEKSTLREVLYDQLASIEISLESDPCSLNIFPKQETPLSLQVPHRHYNQLNELASRLRSRIRQVSAK